ncbi:uncharacterized protein LOC141651024 [Silene latifolia]|uniref:uncharacterized protein LOC141651024 n=1 Tax=Silene latifolia TaxID=37657 RepID=UPI003D76F1E6
MDGNGGCCIARWTDGGHVVSGSKMDMIMLKFRPIAPKPVSPTGTPAATSDSSNNSPRDGPHAKGPTRGRRKNNNNNSKTKVSKSSNNGRKRKSNSPENRTAEIFHQDDYQDQTVGGGGVTLLPLFPEAPDLSPTNQQEDPNNHNNNVPIWVNFNEGYNTNNTLGFENNYGNCHGYGW